MSKPLDLRPYQLALIAEIEAAWRTHRRLLGVLPTGGGKTVVMAEIIRRETAARRKVLVLAHRREIVTQTSQKLQAARLAHGLVMPGESYRQTLDIQVATVQTMHARAVRRESMPLPPADLVVIDEAHHATAETYRAIVEAYPQARVLGLTATPTRGDGRGLGGIFEALVEGPQVADLVALGFLVPTRIYAPPPPDLRGVGTRAGDYVLSDLAERLDKDKLVGDIVEHWLRHAEHRPTVAFATSVAHSLHIRDAFRAQGVKTEHIDGDTPTDEREAVLRMLAHGETTVVANCRC